MARYDVSLSGRWRFHLGEPKKKPALTNDDYHIMAQAGGGLHEYEPFGADGWIDVDVPHDWLTHLPYDKNANAMNGYKPRGCGWYYKKVTIPASTECARIVFDGILGISSVYVNGTLAVRNFSGYNRFSADIGNYLVDGENEIAVKVNAERGEGWFYEGAGIYRRCRIELRDYTHIDTDECFVRCDEENGTNIVKSDIKIADICKDKLILSTKICDASGKVMVSYECDAAEHTSFDIPCPDALLWSPEHPNLYRAVFSLLRCGEEIDRFVTNIAFRKIEYKVPGGMYLNGEKFRVKGICSHQDHAGVGAATTNEINEYRIQKLKSLGINAYRTAHHAVTDDFLDICDRAGILVMVENRTFSSSADAMAELASMVKVARNHPSVFIYSLFNEESWQNDIRGYKIAKALREKILSLDSTRPVTAAQNTGILHKNNASDALDIIGVNYNLANYEKCHERTPDKLILGTENCPTFATRGIYKTDKEKRVFSSYGDDYADWFSESIDETMAAVERYPFVIGCFAWCGFGHRGEPVPYDWPSVISHWGFMDSCGFENDTAYLLRAYYSDELCVHLLPHWNFAPGEKSRVMAFTNAERAELFLNGKSLGIREVKNRRAEWYVSFEAGAIRVEARRAADTVYDEIRTAGELAALVIEDATVNKNSPASRVINLMAVDNMGAFIYNFAENIDIELDNGKILGVGNGDPNAHFDEKASSIRAHSGRAQIIVSGDTAKITVRSMGLSASLKF